MSEESDKQQQEIATLICRNVAEQFSLASRACSDSAEACTLATSLTLVGVTATAMYITKVGNDNPPNNDDVLFTCLFVANSVCFNDDGAALVEFETSNVVKTLQMFWDITGRSFEPGLNEGLLRRVNDSRQKAEAAMADKFRPQ